jgi:hypothetical protein
MAASSGHRIAEYELGDAPDAALMPTRISIITAPIIISIASGRL